MRRHAVLLAIMVLAIQACGRSATPAATGPAAAPAPAATAAAPAHQHGPAAATTTAGAAVAARPMMMMDSGAMRVRHNRGFLVSADSLAAQLASGRIVVVHVGRSDSAYLAGHVPGARFLRFAAVSTTVNGIANEFPPVEAMANAFSALVIRDDQRIVVYDDGQGLLAARAWIALDLMGHSGRAALLDGGLTAWRAGGRSVETGPVAVPMVHIPFPAAWQADRVVSAEWVRTRLGDSTVVLVDARPADQFGGAETPCRPDQPACVNIPEARRGHIPGAKNIPWLDALVSRDNPVLKPMHQLHHMQWMAAGADAAPVRTVVTYCRTGNQAALAYFVARYVGYPDVRFYDGSFIEWAGLNAERFPVSRAAAGGGEHQHH